MTTIREIQPSDLERLAARAAGWLRAKGLREGDRVAVRTPNDPRLLALTHGALRTGIVPVFVNPHLHQPDRDWILKDSAPHLVVDELDALDWNHTPVDLADVP